jgi:hypothetical protein
MIAAYYALHYGKEWLKWSMRSVREHVDEIHVFYVSKPSHGTQTPIPCPETETEIRDIVDEFDAVWWECPHFHWEGEHRDFAVNVLKHQRKADTILVVDGDEVWTPEHLTYAILAAEKCNTRNNLVYMRHFWRSLKWVCDDLAAPVRILRPNGIGDINYIDGGKVFHMGYAQSPSIIEYKQQIHGHKAEWRDGWFDDIFIDWMPGDEDVHPTNIDFWTPHKYYDESDVLKQLVGDHPYWGLDIIE